MNPLTAFALGVLITLVVKPFLSSYSSKKGANAADKEDIGALTAIAESIRHSNAVLLEHLKSTQQLRLAAVDKRLAVHQEAFVLWRKLYSATHDPAISKLVLECQDWWASNCLYLEPKARQAFADAYQAAWSHRSYVDNGRGNPEGVALVKENWEKIVSAGNVIVEAVALPGLGRTESLDVAKPEVMRANV